MKDKTARILAIIALVFMAVFLAAFITALVDPKIFGGAIVYIVISFGIAVLVIFIILKADDRGYSISKINEQIEMQKIEKENNELIAASKAQPERNNADGENA